MCSTEKQVSPKNLSLGIMLVMASYCYDINSLESYDNKLN